MKKSNKMKKSDKSLSIRANKSKWRRRLKLLTNKQHVAGIKETRLCQKYKHVIASICQYVPRPTAIKFVGGGREGTDNDHGDGDDDLGDGDGDDDHGDGDDDHGDGDDDHGDGDDDHDNVVGDY